MFSKERSHEIFPNRISETKRIRSERLLSNVFFPASIHDPEKSLDSIHDRATEGWGLLVAVNHFALRDGPAVFAYIVGKEPAYRNKPWLAPIGYHQKKIADIANTILGTAIELKPIVTQDAMKHESYRNEQKGHGKLEYIRRANQVLGDGGVVVIFPQIGRRSSLGEANSENKGMEFLFETTTRKNINSFMILPVGLGIDTENYESVSGLNLFKRYDVHIGSVYTKEQAKQDAVSSNHSIDEWIFSKIRPLVPESYR